MPSRRKRLSKREIKHDPVIEYALAGWSYALRNKNMVLGIGLGAILLVVIVLGLTSYRTARVRDAEALLSRSLLHLTGQDREVGLELLEELAEDRRGTSAGKRAVYYLAQAKFEDGMFSEAKELFERYTSMRGGDRLLRASAAKGVADCLSELGQVEDAGRAYLSAAERFSGTPLTADCYYLAGLALRESTDRAGAKAALEQLVQKYPEYSRIGDARVLLGELQARDLVLEHAAVPEVGN